jgi:hypothetical protein
LNISLACTISTGRPNRCTRCRVVNGVDQAPALTM